MKSYYSLIVVVVLFISGCIVKEAIPMKYYTLKIGKMPIIHNSPFRDKVLKVSYPKTLTGKLTNKIAFSYSSSDRGVYQNSRWSNTLEKLIEGNIIATLHQIKIFKAVLAYNSTATADLRLESVVYDFSHYVRKDASYAIISMGFILIDVETGKLIKTKYFSYREDTETTDAKGYAKAVNIAMTRLIKDLIKWIKSEEGIDIKSIPL
ncbi:MAG: ABC-type transport auxiliary lipoprotein family protein [Sulfurovum sp.]|nr:ABC-type transport auxiliary lipoprotein family protein [Sulfurovum sp.]